MSEHSFEFSGVDAARWDDLTALFEARGGPHNCWCMMWRDKPPAARSATGSARKSALKSALRSRVSDGVPVGILGYCNGAPVAWCSIAPRSSYRALSGPDDHDRDDTVWSLVCFFIKREFRGHASPISCSGRRSTAPAIKEPGSLRHTLSIQHPQAIASWVS